MPRGKSSSLALPLPRFRRGLSNIISLSRGPSSDGGGDGADGHALGGEGVGDLRPDFADASFPDFDHCAMKVSKRKRKGTGKEMEVRGAQSQSQFEERELR